MIPVVIDVFQDKSFTFITKSPPASILIKKLAGMRTEGKPGSGANNPGKEIVAKITRAQLEEIVKIKENDLNSYDMASGVNIIAGTARSMGVQVVD